jgi:hypothetical protein
MLHGDHWGAVEQDADEYIDAMLPLICKEGKLVGETRFSHSLEEVDKKEGVVSGLQYPVPESPVSFLALVATQLQEGVNYVWSAYPVCAEGPCNHLVVDEVKLWPNGVEGAVEAYMPEGDVVCFFDPFFFLNREKYQEWAEIDVALSALAYVLEKAEPDDEAETDATPPEQASGSAPEQDAGITASATDDEDIPAEYYPCGQLGDSAQIEFIVEEAVPVACIGRLFWRMTGVIMRADDETEMRLHVYASEQVLKGYAPEPGDHVLAVAWVQGRLLAVAQSADVGGSA